MEIDKQQQHIGLKVMQLLWNNSLSTSVYESLMHYIFEQFKQQVSTISLFIVNDSKHFMEEHFLSNQYNVREVCEKVLRERIEDLPEDASFRLLKRNDGHELMIALRREHRLIGVLEIYHLEPLEKEVIETLIYLSEIISMSIANVMTTQKANELFRAVNTLADMPQLLMRCRNIKELIMTYGKHIVKHLQLDRVSIFLQYGHYEKQPQRYMIDFQGKVDHLIDLKNPDFHYQEITKSDSLEGFWVPVVVYGKRIGYILYDNIYSAYTINDSVRDTLMAYTTQFAVAAENLMLVQEITIMAEVDSLTGVYNRNFFEKLVKKIDAEQFRPYAVILGDVNGLKITNDVFGHFIGDQLLVHIANILKSSVMQQGTLARWGGDEFIVFLPHISEEGVVKICKQVITACEKVFIQSLNPSISLGYSINRDGIKSINDHIVEAEDMMYRDKLMDKNSYRNNFISTLKGTLHEKCQETEEHLDRMNFYAEKISVVLGLNGNDTTKMKLLAYLHDIGKVSISDTILNKPGRLTNEEYEIMKTHSEAGYRIVNSAPELAYIAELILYHHERWDGNGYPRGLKGEEIPMLSRIISIIDAYDVITSKRSYKEAQSHDLAVQELQRCSGTQFDPNLIEIICRNKGSILSESESTRYY